MNSREAVERNRASWEVRTAIHRNSPAYARDIALLKEGGCCLAAPVCDEIGSVEGLRIAHLQCHIGTDSLALARRGAHVTGLDFSEASVEMARELSRELAIRAEFLVGDAMEAHTILEPGSYDLVFATFGVLCWIPDLNRWMQAAAQLVRPGGALYLCDGHPFLDVFDEDETSAPVVRHGYFDRNAMEFGPGLTYADDGSGCEVPGTVQYQHPVGEIIGQAIAAGLMIEFFHEFPQAFFQKFGFMQRNEDGIWEMPDPLKGALPFLFSLRARKPLS